jgi:predicted nucleotidyltransferase
VVKSGSVDRVLSPAVAAALAELKGALRARFAERLREVVLFGSHARGEAHEESDVDVLVVIDALTETEKVAVFDLAYDVDRVQPEWLGINPFVRSTDDAAEMRARERLLFRDIDREGIPL